MFISCIAFRSSAFTALPDPANLQGPCPPYQSVSSIWPVTVPSLLTPVQTVPGTMYTPEMQK